MSTISIYIIRTYCSESLSSVSDSQPVSLDHLVANPAESDGAEPHDRVREGRERACPVDVELEDSCHVLGEVSHHREVTVVVPDLWTTCHLLLMLVNVYFTGN